MRAAILAAQPKDPADVTRTLVAPVPEPVFYQKHMTHHMLDDFPTEWMDSMQHVFLIRHPARVIASYARKREHPSLEDLGFVQQMRLFERVDDPIVIDAADIREAPRPMLQALCRALDLSFEDQMLTWPSGGHPSDGVWASHWYGAVHRSTGFDGPEDGLPLVGAAFRPLLQAALPLYEALAGRKLS